MTQQWMAGGGQAHVVFTFRTRQLAGTSHLGTGRSSGKCRRGSGATYRDRQSASGADDLMADEPDLEFKSARVLTFGSTKRLVNVSGGRQAADYGVPSSSYSLVRQGPHLGGSATPGASIPSRSGTRYLRPAVSTALASGGSTKERRCAIVPDDCAPSIRSVRGSRGQKPSSAAARTPHSAPLGRRSTAAPMTGSARS